MIKQTLFALSMSALPLVANTDTSSTYPRTIDASMNEEAGEMDRMYNFCVGAGRANEGLRADWQRQLRVVRDEIGARYIRFHGLFCDDMGVYKVDDKGEAQYNWQYVDELFDFIQSIGMKPFIELGFMPNDMASGEATIFWYKGNITPPKDYQDWADLVEAFTRHVTERYGREEVLTWYFEVWNEPNLWQFWLGNPENLSYEEYEPIMREEYYVLYDYAVKAVRSVDANYRVGGPATAGAGWIQETIDHCAENDVPIDFLSTHTYATMAGFLDEKGNAGTILAPNRDAVTDQVLKSRAIIDQSKFSDAELHFTEWSSSYTPTDPMHDSYHSAAFILDKMKNSGGHVTSMSYWTFTDIFEENGPRMKPFHGGFGMMNYQDLKKPAFYAYKFLNQLGDTELTTKDPQAFICKDDEGGAQALIWDFVITQHGDVENNQAFFLRDQPANPLGTTTLNISDLKPGPYLLEVYQVGYRINDVQTAWRDMGMPNQLTRKQVQTLQQFSNGTPSETIMVEVSENGTFSKEMPMRENDVFLLSLTPM